MVFSTTFRSRATGARMSKTTGMFVLQYCRLPRNTLRASAKVRLVTGVSGWTTTATSTPRALSNARGCNEHRHRHHRSKAALGAIFRSAVMALYLEGERGLKEYPVDTWFVDSVTSVSVLPLERGVVCDVVSDAKRGTHQV